jgi:putative membrane protein
MPATRFPRSVYGHGREPDPRFSLANERTFLAWIRTSLALLAVGVALEALQLPIRADFRFSSAVVFVVLGLLAPVHAWFNWARIERAVRQDRALPAPALSGVLAAGVVVGGLLIAAGMFL